MIILLAKLLLEIIHLITDKNLSFGYIKSDLSNEELQDKNIYIEIEKKKYPAEILLKPLKQINFKTI
jgi:4-methylaminobutanoate oxidase (formaldehyde-forming)